MTLVCNATTLSEIVRDNPNMTVKAFLEGLTEPLEGKYTLEDLDYEEYLESLDRDYRDNKVDYI